MSDTPTEPQFVTCLCQVCSGKIEFDASHAGESVACPHCGLETTLYAPQVKLTKPAQSVSVEIKRGVSPLGIASLVLGIIACTICAAPFLAHWAINVALIGVALSVAGVLMAARNRKTGFEFPISGGIVNVLSIIIALVVNGEFATLVQKIETKTGDHKPLIVPSRTPPAFRQGNITVEIFEVADHYTMGESPTDRGLIVKTRNFLTITVVLYNLSTNRIVDYTTFRDDAILTDDNGNNYRKLRPLNVTQVETGRVGWKTPDFWDGSSGFYENSFRISPELNRVDMLGFEIPDSPGKVLHLELSAEHFGGTGKIEFEIPVSMIKDW